MNWRELCANTVKTLATNAKVVNTKAKKIRRIKGLAVSMIEELVTLAILCSKRFNL